VGTAVRPGRKRVARPAVDPAGNEGRDLETISAECGWDRHPDRTHGVARSLYLRLPDEADLWVAGSEFVSPEWPAIRAAPGAAPAPRRPSAGAV
jgi:hypothetical protein